MARIKLDLFEMFGRKSAKPSTPTAPAKTAPAKPAPLFTYADLELLAGAHGTTVQAWMNNAETHGATLIQQSVGLRAQAEDLNKQLEKLNAEAHQMESTAQGLAQITAIAANQTNSPAATA